MNGKGMTRRCYEVMVVALAWLPPVAMSQEDWPHFSRDWQDPLFQARVQGVYDWIGSGPDRINMFEYLSADAISPTDTTGVPFYLRSTYNRDTDTFPPRTEIDTEASSISKPKDWLDREALIAYMRDNTRVEPGFFEDRIDAEAGPDTYFLQGNLYFLQSRFTAAAASYGEAVQRFPNFKLAQQNLAFTQLILGDCEAALLAVERAIALGALNAYVMGLQAYCAREQELPGTAVAAIAMTRLLEPDNPFWQELELDILRRAGRHDASRAFANAHFSAAPLSVVRLDAMAAQYREQDRDLDLLAILEIKQRAGLATAADSASLNELKRGSGVSHLAPPDMEGATAQSSSSEAGLASPSARAGALLLETQGLVMADDFELAAARIDAALNLQPMNCDALVLAAEIYSRLEQMQRAASLLSRLRSHSSDCADATLLQQARLYLLQQQWQPALERMQLHVQGQRVGGQPLSHWERRLVRDLSRLVQMGVN